MIKICLILFYILFSVKIFASAPAPSPKCDVVGVIENVRFEVAYNNPCIRLNNCPTDVQTVFPDRYYLTVKVQSVAYREGDVTITTCNDLYQVGQSQEFLINKSAVNENDVFGVGQTISGTAISFGDKLFETYSIGLALRKTGETCGLDLTNGKMLPNCEAGLECKSPNGTRLVNGFEETTVGGNSVCVKNCTPRPACIDGVVDGSGNKVYCDPKPGVVYCPRSNISPFPTWILEIKGDTNGDRKVDLVDFSIWKSEYLGTLSTKLSDFNKDSKVDLVDFSVWKNAYLELSI